jgi:bifunctional non-homologous end joining protein LigD
MSNRKQAPRGRLEAYRAKRSTQRTPEPFGGPGNVRPRLFVVQKHHATRLHYDFRLEWNGTLMSWAVPKGPSMNPDDKRFAAQVEDHPVEYADFEGVIPKGNYGAGPVIVWDKGLWVPLDDPDALEETGKLHLMLHGYKLRGEWILIRLKSKDKDTGKDWLLRKKPDAWATRQALYGEESVHSGLSLDEVRNGQTRAATLRKALKKHKAPQRPLDVMTLPIPLAETAEAPFSDADWIFELKYDGYRILAHRSADAQPRLRSRNAHDLTATFPEVARALRSFPYADLIVDGEIVVLDEQGKPDFGLLQQRAKLTRVHDIERAAIEHPATYFVFDLLGFEDFDVRPLPLGERKKLLEPLLPKLGPIRFADHVAERGEDMFAHVQKMGLEGIMAKKLSAPYGSGRVRVWLKVVADHTDDFVVCGFTTPKGARSGFGALHVGIHQNGRLVYAGRVGTGFNESQLTEWRALLDDLQVDTPACEGAPEASREHHWVRPEWVVEVRYKEITRDGMLRAPVFLRRRDDKDPGDCVRDDVVLDEQPPAAGQDPERPPQRDRVQFTNTDKIFFPEDGITKGDLIAYYETVAPWILPYLVHRPLVLTRFPDGIHGKSFYQKNAPDFVPDWIRREAVWSESSQREIEYFVCDDVDTLMYIANMGAIPLHIWSSRVEHLQNPDFCIIDLDPKEAPFRDVLTLARATHSLCEEIGLPNYVKTTGSTGLHVLIPLGRQCTFEQSRMLGHLIARVLEAEHRDIATTARHMASRKGRVYLDYLQNRHGQLIVAPYCVRPLPTAPVSAPLEWREVNARLKPQKWTIRNLPRRLARKSHDPMLPLLQDKPDLVAALSRLSERLQSS